MQDVRYGGSAGVLVVHYGTADRDGRLKSLDMIEGKITEKFKNFNVFRAFSSDLIIKRIEIQEGVHINSVDEALKEAASSGIKYLVVVPTYIVDGIEYQQLVYSVEENSGLFEKTYICKPLLTKENAAACAAEIIAESLKMYDDGETAICFMGHGTVHSANKIYAQIQNVWRRKNYVNYYVGTRMQGADAEFLLEQLKSGRHSYKRVVLVPLMVAVGRHARVDMAGNQASSWKCIFEKSGYTVTCVLKGIGEIPEIQELFADNAMLACANIISFLDTPKSV